MSLGLSQNLSFSVFITSIDDSSWNADHLSSLGNLPEIFQSQAGVPDFKYQQVYGDVVRIKGPFGVKL